jgi:two-component system NtrC family response regulator
MNVLNMVGRIAKTNASVLITGESGTGKEQIAEAIHMNSPRARRTL